MRIAFVAWRDMANPLAGGAEVFVDRLALSLQDMGHEVTLLCGGPIEQRPYRVIETGGTYSQYLKAPLVFRKAAGDVDLVVDTENGIPFFSPLWCRSPIVTVVHHVHLEQWADRFPKPVAAAGRFLEATAMPWAYRRTPFIAVSESTAEALADLGVDAAHISVLHQGVDRPGGLAGSRSSEPLFVCLGRLMPHKRVDLLLRAWEQVRPVTGGTLVIIGDGPERASLEAAAGEGVSFVGKVDDDEKWRLLSAAWALVHPAHHEGWGIVIIEAAEVGTPAVGFRVAGVRDAIVDGETGRLADTEEEFVRSWIEMGSDDELRDRFSAGARARAAMFDWPEVAQRFMEIAAEVVAPKRGTR